MTTTRHPTFVPEVWHPYHSAMLPDMWLNQGGQSAAGAAIDHLLTRHPAYPQAAAQAGAAGLALPVWRCRSGAAGLAGQPGDAA